MRYFDKKFRQNKRHYVLQACFAGIAIAVALTFFDIVKQPIIVASFGASAFIAFTMPHRIVSNSRHLIGGYVVGVATGCLIHYVAVLAPEVYALQKGFYVIAGAIAVALSMFIMTVTDTEHPPASSIALGFVINEWTLFTVIHVLVGITVISFIQKLLKSRMMDLLDSSGN